MMIVLHSPYLATPLLAAIVAEGDVTPDVALWDSSTQGFVAWTADGSVLVDGGSKLFTQNALVSFGTDVQGKIRISGDGSSMDLNTLNVGHFGIGEVVIEDGGEIISNTTQIGLVSGSNGTVNVTGVDSTFWSDTLLVGVSGDGNLTVTDGGIVYTDNLNANLSDLHGNGSIFVDNGAILDADLLFDSSHGNQNVLTFGEGGTLELRASGGRLGVGYETNGSLTIKDGISVDSSFAALGVKQSASGAALVTGTDSTWNVRLELSVGQGGNGMLFIENDAQVMVGGHAYIADHPGTAGLLQVSEPGSEFNGSKTLFIGYEGNADLIVDQGATVRNHDAFVGTLLGSESTARVSGIGTHWGTQGNLMVGYEGTGSLTIASNGLVSVGGTLTIDANINGGSNVNMASGGMLALLGDADDSLQQFLSLVGGTDAIRFWNHVLEDWAPLAEATIGKDYSLSFVDQGELAGYTVLTVGTVPEPRAITFVLLGMIAVVNAGRQTKRTG